MIEFIRQCGAAFVKAGFKTKFLIGDTANGSSCYDYVLPILKDSSIARYLGPISFHSWDALNASDISYQKIKELGLKYKKQVWCMEAGHDAQLWQRPNPWASWDNAMRTALAYERTIRLTGASSMVYWTYQDNYTLVDPKTFRPYPVFRALQLMEKVFTPGAVLLNTEVSSEDMKCITTQGKRGFSMLLISPVGKGNAVIKGFKKNTRVYVTKLIKSKFVSFANEFPMKIENVDANGELKIDVPERCIFQIEQR
jgi:hypothetical protein